MTISNKTKMNEIVILKSNLPLLFRSIEFKLFHIFNLIYQNQMVQTSQNNIFYLNTFQVIMRLIKSISCISILNYIISTAKAKKGIEKVRKWKILLTHQRSYMASEGIPESFYSFSKWRTLHKLFQLILLF